MISNQAYLGGASDGCGPKEVLMLILDTITKKFIFISWLILNSDGKNYLEWFIYISLFDLEMCKDLNSKSLFEELWLLHYVVYKGTGAVYIRVEILLV